MHYSLLTIIIAIKIIIFSRTSLRGSNYIFSLFEPYMNTGTPSYITTQMWVLKYGLYLLNNKKEKRDDWILILDHTIEFGKKKCLVIIGIPREKLLNNKMKIKHKDFTVLDIDITEKADFESVKSRVEKLEQEIGTPIQFVCDGGSNLQKGLREFIEARDKQQIIKTYDVTHKASIILKSFLETNERWLEFSSKVTETKSSVLHTIIAFMVPPKPKEKSRWLNIEPFVKWAENALLQSEEEMNEEAKEKYNSKILWIKEFKNDMQEWRMMIDMLNIMMFEIKNEGLSKKTANNIITQVDSLNLESNNLTIMRSKIIEFVTKETKELDGAFLGCSDIIESIFGRYKKFSSKTPMKEVGKALLTIPIFTSDVEPNEVKLAMESITENDIKVWLNKNIGSSLISKRKKFYSLKKNVGKVGEEKLDIFKQSA